MRGRVLVCAALSSLCAVAGSHAEGLRILAADGQPLSGARVQVWAPLAEGDAAAAMTPPFFRGETSETGAVPVEPPARRGFLLLVNHPGHEPFSAELEPPFFTGGLRLEAGWTWAGRVEAEGPFAATGRLCVRWSTALPRWQLTPEWERCTEIGLDGSFTLAGLSRVPLQATIDVPGFLRREIALEPSSPPRDLRVERGRIVRGRVVTGAASAPVPGATVRAVGSAPVRTGAGGDFEIALVEEGRELSIEAAGFRTARLAGAAPASDDPLLIRLMPSQRVELVLTTPRGEPAAKGWVQVELLAEHGRRRSWGAALEGGEQGRFRLDLPEPGRYRLGVSAPGWLGAKVPAFSLAPSELRDLGVLALEPGASLEARLVDARTNQPVTGAEVSYGKAGLAALQALARQQTPRAISDRQGAFVLAGLPPGRAILTVDHPAYARRRIAVVLQSNEERREPPIWLDPGVRLEGVVQGFAERGGEGLSVGLFRLDLGDALPEVEATTGAGGSFTFPGLSPASYRVVVRGAQPMLAQDLEVAPNLETQRVELLLPMARISGRVLRQGLPVDGGALTLRPRLDPGRETGKVVVQMEGRRQAKLVLGTGVGSYGAEIDAEGRFVLTGIPPGSYDLASNAAPASAWRIEVPAAGLDELEIELSRPATRGRLLDSQTADGVSGEVELIEAGGSVLARASADRDGWFEIAAPEAEGSRLRLGARGYRARLLAWASAEAVAATELALEPAGAGDVRVRVADAAGEPVPMVMVTLVREGGGMQASLLADAEGEKRFSGVPAGKYLALVADPAAGSAASAWVSARGGSEEVIELTLAPGSWVELACEPWRCGSRAVERLDIRRDDGFDWTPFLPSLSPGLRLSEDGRLALGILGSGTYEARAVVAGQPLAASFRVNGFEPVSARLR